MIWNTSRAFPPVRACLFSHGLTGITFLGDPSAGSGLPRGTMVYANMPIPFQVSTVACSNNQVKKDIYMNNPRGGFRGGFFFWEGDGVQSNPSLTPKFIFLGKFFYKFGIPYMP